MIVQGDSVVKQGPQLYVVIVIMLQHLINFALHTAYLAAVICKVILNNLHGILQILLFRFPVCVFHETSFIMYD